jgi:hypothetical protein
MEILFADVAKVWNKVRGVRGAQFECQAINIPELTRDSPCCLITNNPKNGQVILPVLSLLVKAQNRILSRLIEGIVKRTEISHTTLNSIRRSEILQINFEEVLEQNVFASVIRSTNSLSCNLSLLHRTFTSMCRYKAIIDEIDLPEFHFRGLEEATFGELFASLSKKAPATLLPKETLRNISLRNSEELFHQIESSIIMIEHNPDVGVLHLPLSKYIQTRLKEKPHELLCDSSIKVNHLEQLWRACVKEEVDAPIEFQERLTHQEQERYSTFLQSCTSDEITELREGLSNLFKVLGESKLLPDQSLRDTIQDAIEIDDLQTRFPELTLSKIKSCLAFLQ